MTEKVGFDDRNERDHTMQHLYLAGPMSNRPYFNFPAFDQTATSLRARGFRVSSPAELDDPATRKLAMASEDGDLANAGFKDSWADFLSRDVKLIAEGVDGVAVMSEWWTSKGARLEAYVANLLGLPVYAAAMLAVGDPRETAELTQEWIDRGVQGRAPHLGLAADGLFQGPITTTESYTFPGPIRSHNIGGNVGEIRVTSKTGGQKGSKPERLDLLPPEFLWGLSRVYSMGADKYDDHNYLKGYDWSLSYAACLRHLTQWANGQNCDQESGLSHLLHAAWHCAALYMYQTHDLGTDDRLSKAAGLRTTDIEEGRA